MGELGWGLANRLSPARNLLNGWKRTWRIDHISQGRKVSNTEEGGGGGGRNFESSSSKKKETPKREGNKTEKLKKKKNYFDAIRLNTTTRNTR